MASFGREPPPEYDDAMSEVVAIHKAKPSFLSRFFGATRQSPKGRRRREGGGFQPEAEPDFTDAASDLSPSKSRQSPRRPQSAEAFVAEAEPEFSSPGDEAVTATKADRRLQRLAEKRRKASAKRRPAPQGPGAEVEDVAYEDAGVEHRKIRAGR